jgi:hypothetical protein
LWRKVVEFEVKGEPIHRSIQTAVWNTVHNLGCIVHYSDEYYKLRDTVRNLDLSNYYLNGNGPKVTKLLRKALKEVYPDKRYEAEFPELCRKVSELYLPQATLSAYWGDKSMIGEGVWECNTTCFSTTGCNAVSKEFVKRFDRVQVLVLAMKGTRTSQIVGYKDIPCGCGGEGCTLVIDRVPIFKEVHISTTFYARCLVYFLGGRILHLTNFYYNGGIPQNHRLHVEALRRLLGLRKVKFNNAGYIDLPIYLNGDGVKVECEERSKEYKGVRKFPCPHCSSQVDENSFHHNTYDNTHYLGCSEECAGGGGTYLSCVECNDEVHVDDAHYQDGGTNDDPYCSSCYSRIFCYCDSCGHDVHLENYLGNGLCIECGTTCSDCGEATPNDDAYYIDGSNYCPRCYREKFMECEECGEEVEREATIDDLCPSCYEKKEEELEKREEATI